MTNFKRLRYSLSMRNLREYPYLTKRLRSLVLSDQQIDQLIDIIVDTCGSCHNADAGCQCWNDE